MRGLFLAGVACAVAMAALLYFDRSGDDDGPVQLPPELADEPDIYMFDALITQFAPDGSLKYRLRSEEIQHFEEDQRTRLKQPALVLHGEEQPPWHIRSKLGFLRNTEPSDGSQPEELVLLREDVVMQQQRPESGLLTIRSQSFDVYPGRRHIETADDVMIDSDVGRTVAHGLDGNLDAGLLALSSNERQRVHTIVLPDQVQ